MALAKGGEEYLARFIRSNRADYLWSYTNIPARTLWTSLCRLWRRLHSSLHSLGMED